MSANSAVLWLRINQCRKVKVSLAASQCQCQVACTFVDAGACFVWSKLSNGGPCFFSLCGQWPWHLAASDLFVRGRFCANDCMSHRETHTKILATVLIAILQPMRMWAKSSHTQFYEDLNPSGLLFLFFSTSNSGCTKHNQIRCFFDIQLPNSISRTLR